MLGTKRNHEQFQNLYSAVMPALYRCALYLLGDAKAAEFAVLEAWERSCPRDDDGQREPELRLKFCKSLLYICSKIEKETHYVSEKITGAGDEPLVRALAELTFEDRKVMVLSLVYGFDTAQIAKLTELSTGTVEKRLYRITTRMTRPMRQQAMLGRESA